MKEPITHFWNKRLNDVSQMLAANNFEAYVAANVMEAKKIVLETILPATGAKSVSWGGSVTFVESGIYKALKDNADLDVLDVFEKGLKPEVVLERRRQSLLVDLYITGTNAVTADGQLVNLDMLGNRIGAITFGPKHVIILVGRNKIVSDIPEAMDRIKAYAAPVNAMRLDKKTPCSKTATCEECQSPDRICNTWTITEKSFPQKRVKVVLINEDLGF
jgi:L-lactate utilization protein LutB